MFKCSRMWSILGWGAQDRKCITPTCPLVVTLFYSPFQRSTRHTLERWLDIVDEVHSRVTDGSVAFETIDCVAPEEEDRDVEEGIKTLPTVVMRGPDNKRTAWEGEIEFDFVLDAVLDSLDKK